MIHSGEGESGDPRGSRSTTETKHRAVDVDVAIDLLSHGRRRRAVDYLSGRVGERVRVAELVEAIVERDPEAECAPSDAGRGVDERVAIELHHVHLPKLAAAGTVGYEPGSDEVRYIGDRRLERLLRAVDEDPLTEAR